MENEQKLEFRINLQTKTYLHRINNFAALENFKLNHWCHNTIYAWLQTKFTIRYSSQRKLAKNGSCHKINNNSEKYVYDENKKKKEKQETKGVNEAFNLLHFYFDLK